VDVDRAMRQLSERLVALAPQLAVWIFERQAIDSASQRALVDVFSIEVRKRSIAATLDSIFTGLASGRATPEEPPTVSVEFARVAARSGIELNDLVRAYRIGHAVTWDVVLEQVDELTDDRAERLAVLQIVSRFLFDWNDQVTVQISVAYQRERDRMYRDRERRKRELIRDILDGLPVDATKLAYDLAGPHVGFAAWGAAPDDLARRIATDLGSSLLTVTGASDSVLGWFGGAALDELEFPDKDLPTSSPGTYLAFGRRCRNVEGFRLTHRQATQAWRVGQLAGNRVTRFQDVTIEALVSADPSHIRDFVTNEIGGLLTDDARDRVLRDTLRAYFRTGQNAASAAPLLGVHERTVAYRLRTMEDRLGCSIAERRDELAVALRLLDLVDPERDAGPTPLDESG